jgi:hypothetical protein
MIARKLLVLSLVLAGSCRVDPDQFQQRVFHCDTAAPDPLCGTDGDGNAMRCFAARQLGGSDFCTQICDTEPMSLPDEGAVCVQGQSKLKACNPADDGNKAEHPLGACDRREFGCLRTDVLAQEGVCVTMNPCGKDVDCHDPVRSTCAATFLTRLYKDHKSLRANNLYCLQEGCQGNRTACSPGETCLRDVIPADANPPDICVPNCDSHLQCPPNHFCYRKISGPANPAVCIPGLLGFVCDTDLDCLVGKCRDDGNDHNLRLCTTACSTDDDCKKFDSEQGQFICNQFKQCATPSAYRGASCDSDLDCMRNAGTSCIRFSPQDRQGTCLYPCRIDGSCQVLGGINHTCLQAPTQVPATPVCFPGFFGMPCFSDGNCVGGLSCRGADLMAADPTPGICTGLCQTDDDCAKNRWTAGQSICGAPLTPSRPVCLPLLSAGDPCETNAQCASKICTGTARNKTCAGSGATK